MQDIFSISTSLWHKLRPARHRFCYAL